VQEQDDAPPPSTSTSLFVTRTIGGAPAAARQSFRGRAIDLDVKNADIHEVCRLLADVGKVNIVVSDDVRGEITIKMKHVPWDQALDVILRAKGFRAERDGNIILVLR
jgi:type IV pilus assembly protein PilQ